MTCLSITACQEFLVPSSISSFFKELVHLFHASVFAVPKISYGYV